MDARILYLAINLEISEVRRAALLAQAQRAGMELEIVPAVRGADVGHMDASFDGMRRKREYANDLLPTEVACCESHLKCLRRFLLSEYSHCLVLEDDACFESDLPEVLGGLVGATEGWDYVKLWSPGRNWPLFRLECGGRMLDTVYPKNLSRETLAILYSRDGARKVLDGMRGYWMAFDTQLGQASCAGGIRGIGVEPPLCVPAAGIPSSIDATGGRRRKVRASLLQWLTHRMQRLVNSLRKRRLFRIVRRAVVLRGGRDQGNS